MHLQTKVSHCILTCRCIQIVHLQAQLIWPCTGFTFCNCVNLNNIFENLYWIFGITYKLGVSLFDTSVTNGFDVIVNCKMLYVLICIWLCTGLISIHCVKVNHIFEKKHLSIRATSCHQCIKFKIRHQISCQKFITFLKTYIGYSALHTSSV